MKPREIESYFRELVRREFGNAVEDKADITSHSGSYYITFDADGVHYAFGFKKRNANKIAKVIRSLK
jgi:hypothetical protein